MLKSLTIKNYRAFESFKLDHAARVNLIVGTNNSGKSSLLEAIYLIASEDASSSFIYILNERGEFSLESIDPRYVTRQLGNYQISHIFHGHDLAGDKAITIQSEAKNNASLKIFMRKKDPQKRLPLDNEAMDAEDRSLLLIFERKGSGLERNEETLRITSDGLLSYRPYPRKVITGDQNAKFVSTNYLAYDALAILWDDITLTPREDKVVEALQILESNVERISFTSRQTSNSGILLKLKGTREPIPLGSMGDGMRRVLAITASLVSVDKGTLLVDEIDTGLYYGVLTDMWRLILETSAKQNAQVFATTHSWDCVRAFQQALSSTTDVNSGCLIRLEKDDDKIEAVSYSQRELDIAIKQGIEVR